MELKKISFKGLIRMKIKKNERMKKLSREEMEVEVLGGRMKKEKDERIYGV